MRFVRDSREKESGNRINSREIKRMNVMKISCNALMKIAT